MREVVDEVRDDEACGYWFWVQGRVKGEGDGDGGQSVDLDICYRWLM